MNISRPSGLDEFTTICESFSDWVCHFQCHQTLWSNVTQFGFTFQRIVQHTFHFCIIKLAVDGRSKKKKIDAIQASHIINIVCVNLQYDLFKYGFNPLCHFTWFCLDTVVSSRSFPPQLIKRRSTWNLAPFFYLHFIRIVVYCSLFFPSFTVVISSSSSRLMHTHMTLHLHLIPANHCGCNVRMSYTII